MTEKAKRDTAIDRLRVASAAGVVWYHAHIYGSYWGYFGLIVFLILSMMFEAGRNIERKTSLIYLARRLLLPWAFWSAAYGAFNILRHKPVLDL